jgi:hypothetical protein
MPWYPPGDRGEVDEPKTMPWYPSETGGKGANQKRCLGIPLKPGGSVANLWVSESVFSPSTHIPFSVPPNSIRLGDLPG